MKSEVKSLTGLRGISALWVVAFHYFSKVMSDGWAKDFISQGYVAVDIFFVLSAFLLTSAYQKKFSRGITWQDSIRFYKKRVNRIYPIYFVVIILIILAQGIDWEQFLINVFLIQTFFDRPEYLHISHWSLSTEWLMYLLFPLYLWGLGRVRCWWLLLLVGVGLRFALPYLPDLFIGNTAGFSFHSEKYLDIPLGINAFIRTFSCYLMGSAMVYFPFRKEMFSLIYPLLVLVFIAIFLPKGVLFIPIFVAILIRILWENEVNSLGKFLGSRIIYFLGEISYSLYLCHTLMGVWRIQIFADNVFNKLMWLLLSIILSVIGYYCIERKIKIFKI